MKSAGHLFTALAALALVTGITYGLLAHELAGAVMLGVFSVALVYIATILTNAGPYDRAEIDENAEPEIGPEHTFPPSWWPFVMAMGAGMFLLGLKFNIVVMSIGLGIFFVGAIGWFIQAGHHAAHHTAQTAQHGDGEPSH